MNIGRIIKFKKGYASGNSSLQNPGTVSNWFNSRQRWINLPGADLDNESTRRAKLRDESS